MPEQTTRAPIVATRLVTLFLVLGGFFAVYLVGSTIDGVLDGDHEVVVRQTAPVDRLDALPPEVVVPVTVPVTLRVEEAGANQLALAMGKDAGPVVLLLAGLWLVRGLVRSVRDGDPFTAANVRRLRAIGLLLGIGVPLVAVVSSGFSQALAASWSSPSANALSTPLDLSFSGPLAGLGVFVLAEVFARGVRMRDDIEGTV